MERVGGMLPLEVSDVITSSCYNHDHGQVCYTVLLSTECVCAHCMVRILDSKRIVGWGLVLDSNVCSSIISEMTVWWNILVVSDSSNVRKVGIKFGQDPCSWNSDGIHPSVRHISGLRIEVGPHVNNHSTAVTTALLLFFMQSVQLLAEINEYYSELLNMLGSGSNAHCFLVWL